MQSIDLPNISSIETSIFKKNWDWAEYFNIFCPSLTKKTHFWDYDSKTNEKKKKTS